MRNKLHLIWLGALCFTALWLMSCSDDSTGPQNTEPTNEIDAASIDGMLTDLENLGIGCTLQEKLARTRQAALATTDFRREVADQALAVVAAKQLRAVTEEFGIAGTCAIADPGSLTVTIDVNEDTGAFSGNLLIDDLCLEMDEENELYAAGGAVFNGTLELDSEDELVGLTFNASTTGSGITVETPDVDASFSMTGLSLSVDMSDPGGAMSLTLGLANLSLSVTDASGTTDFSLSDVSVSITVGGDGSMTATFSGTIGLDGGTVNVSTPTPITVNDAGEITGGAIMIEGANGTYVQITYAGFGIAGNVDADTDGDGEIDYSEVMDCSDINMPE